MQASDYFLCKLQVFPGCSKHILSEAGADLSLLIKA